MIMTGNLLFSCLDIIFTTTVVMLTADMDVTTTSTIPRRTQARDDPLRQPHPLCNRYVTPAICLTWSSKRYIVTFIVTHSGHVIVLL